MAPLSRETSVQANGGRSAAVAAVKRRKGYGERMGLRKKTARALAGAAGIQVATRLKLYYLVVVLVALLLSSTRLLLVLVVVVISR